MKKSGWVILTLFVLFLINALVKEKEFLAPEASGETTSIYMDGESSTEIISALSLSGYKRIVVSDKTNADAKI
jgi:hypothetical protein